MTIEDLRNPNKGNTKKQVTGYILGDGEIVTEDELKKYEVNLRKAEDKDLKSAQTSEDNFSELYKGDAQEPRVNPYKMVELLGMSTPHYRCSKQKATDVCGLGWRIVAKEKDTDPKEDIKKMTEFFSNCGGEETFTEICKKAWMDFESVGWLNFEIIREGSEDPYVPQDPEMEEMNINTEKDGLPLRIYHIPAHTIRKSRDKDKYWQIRGDQKVLFRRINLDKELYNKKIEQLKIHPDKKTVISYHEIMEIANYNPKSTYYGMPDVMPALGAIMGNLGVRDYNLQFFDNHAVPRYAVVVEGGEFSPSIKETIRQYFSTGIKGEAHKTLILEVDSEKVKVKFEKLAVEITDGSFKIYRSDNRDEIIMAHGVPPRWVGIAEAGKLGGAEEGRNQAENYMDAYVEPNQQVLAQRFTTNIIEKGFGITTVILEFIGADIKDRKVESEMAVKEVNAGIFTPDEVRDRYYSIGPHPDGVGSKPMVSKNTILLQDLVNQVEEMVKEQKEWISDTVDKLRGDLRHIALQNKDKGTFSKIFRRKK